MGLFGMFRAEKRVHTDPELGELVFNTRSSFWEGTSPFPDSREPIVVCITGDGDGPSAESRALFHELKRRYPVLRDEIARSLFELYENYRSDATEEDYLDGLPRLGSAMEIWPTTVLEDITVWGTEPGHTIELTYVFDWHEDHMFCVHVEDWKVSGVSING